MRGVGIHPDAVVRDRAVHAGQRPRPPDGSARLLRPLGRERGVADDAGRHGEPEPHGQRDRAEALPGPVLPDGPHRRDRRRALQDLARGSGQVRAAEPAALCEGGRGGQGRRGHRADEGESARDPEGQGALRRGLHRRGRRVQPRRHHARRAREAAARVQEGGRGRHRHRGQRLAALRRRVRDAPDERGAREAARHRAARNLPGHRGGGLRPRGDGDRADLRRAEAPEAPRPQARRHRHHRAERGVRVAAALLPARARHRQRQAEPGRRVDLDRAPVRDDRVARPDSCSASSNARTCGIVTMCWAAVRGSRRYSVA